jgi:hypothetical protein
MKACVVLGEPLFKGFSRRAYVVTIVGAVQNVQVRTRIHLLPRSATIIVRGSVPVHCSIPNVLGCRGIAGQVLWWGHPSRRAHRNRLLPISALYIAEVGQARLRCALLRMRSELVYTLVG